MIYNLIPEVLSTTAFREGIATLVHLPQWWFSFPGEVVQFVRADGLHGSESTVASSVIKHTIHGDANITDDVQSIKNLMNMNYDIKR